ncbi:zinc finger (C2H2 type) family protein [Zea mays]|uniref:Zinc finger (C2H2 type) family protein n=1 Tax=Zea mays TaxID=4577 RepID=A0A1D6KLY5_MAIZE|nr:zinc finger (C2H2 type) family protein [Zea mays]
MGGKCPHRKVKKRRLSHKTARRGKFLLKADDAVYDELVKLADQGKDAEAKELPVDEDLPGLGQFYCLHCEYALPLSSLSLPSIPPVCYFLSSANTETENYSCCTDCKAGIAEYVELLVDGDVCKSLPFGICIENGL